ncbi:hypothetical protein SAMN05518866_13635 [Sphingobium sp. YR768]|nr:hypothetical protein SAMN05518866_13635 [Sphingobium sp. YR768]
MLRRLPSQDLRARTMLQKDTETLRSQADASILALEAWLVISSRARNCLAHLNRPTDPASTVASVSIDEMRLSDLSRCTRASVLRAPNLGRVSYCEIAAVMDRYGWRFHDQWTGKPEPPALELLGSSLPRYLQMVTRAAEVRAERFAVGQKMRGLHEQEGLSGAEIGRLFGVSGAAAHASIQKNRRVAELRRLYPQPPPPAIS